MNRRDYAIYMHGYHDAARGSGLSDSPYGGTDGFLWRRGVAAWLDEQDGAKAWEYEHGTETALDVAQDWRRRHGPCDDMAGKRDRVGR